MKILHFVSWVKEKHLIIDLYTKFSLKKKNRNNLSY